MGLCTRGRSGAVLNDSTGRRSSSALQAFVRARTNSHARTVDYRAWGPNTFVSDRAADNHIGSGEENLSPRPRSPIPRNIRGLVQVDVKSDAKLIVSNRFAQSIGSLHAEETP